MGRMKEIFIEERIREVQYYSPFYCGQESLIDDEYHYKKYLDELESQGISQ